MKKNIKLPYLTGVIGFLPLYAIVVVAIQSVTPLGAVIRPVIRGRELDAGLGAIFAVVFAALSLLVIVCALGWIALHGPIARRLGSIEEGPAMRIPGYGLLKGRVTSSTDEGEIPERFAPVIVRTADDLRIGFEVETLPEGEFTAFLPNVRYPKSGHSVIVPAADCAPLNMPATQVLEALATYGRGIGVACHPASSPEPIYAV